MKPLSTFVDWYEFCRKRSIDDDEFSWVVRITRRIDMHKWRESRYHDGKPESKGFPCFGEP